jgi:hypothetical protein
MINPEAYVKFKDLPNTQSMFGNIGKSWDNTLPNDLFVKGIPKSIHRTILSTDEVGNIGTGLDLLHSFTLPANSLAKNGDYLEIIYGGNYANTEDNKQIRLRIDSQLIISFGAVIDLENGNWIVRQRLYRKTSTQVVWAGIDLHVQFRMADGVIITSPSGSFIVPRVNFATVANLSNNAVVIDVHGEGTSDDDVTLRIAEILLTRF